MKRYAHLSWVHLGTAWGLILTMMALTGCSMGYGCGAGYAVNNPALEITTVNDSHTGAAISHIVLSSIRFNGVAVTDLQSLTLPQLARGITVAGDTLACDVPCAFGTNAGTYQFTATAAGYKSASEEFKGGPILNADTCPTSTIGSTQIKFTLDPL